MVTHYARATSQALELLLAIKCNEWIKGAIFSPKTRTAFLFGAANEVAFQIPGRNIHAVELRVERYGDALLLSPGYREARLRVNGIDVIEPIQLPERFVVEAPEYILLGRIYARTVGCASVSLCQEIQTVQAAELPAGCFETTGLPPSPSVVPPSHVRTNDWGQVERVPFRCAQDSQGPSLPFGLSTELVGKGVYDHQYEPTTIVPNMTMVLTPPTPGCTGNERPLSDSEDTRRRLVNDVYQDVPHAEPHGTPGTVVLSERVAGNREARSRDDAPAKPARRNIEEVCLRKPASILAKTGFHSEEPSLRSEGRSSCEAPNAIASPTSSGGSAVPEQRSSGDVSVDVAKAETSVGEVSGRRWQAETRAYSATNVPAIVLPKGSTTPSTEPRRRRRTTSKRSWLHSFGEWAKKRPVGVFALATVGGLLIALAMALMLRLLERSNQVAQVAPASTAAKINSLASVASVAAQNVDAPREPASPNAALASAVPGAVATPQAKKDDRKVMHVNDVAAIEHLVAGRHSEALRAYEKQVERDPADETSLAIVRMLKTKLSMDCDGKATDPAAMARCPEILP